VRWLRVFDGGKTADAAELMHAVGTLRWWQALRREQGWKVDLMVETHDTLITTPAIQRFCAAAPGARLLWDTHHTWKKGGEDPLVTWRALHANVVHIHVKDCVDAPSANHPFTYVLPGTGEFPIAPLLQALRTEFRGCVCLEWEKLWHSYLPDLDVAFRAASAKHWW
jgi:sugar phosphate isomerase/epimerase